MARLKLFLIILLVSAHASAFSQEVNVCIDVRGDTGLEGRVKNVLSRSFKEAGSVVITENKDECQLYVSATLIEQEPIRFYALGISIAYRIRDGLYARPASDVAQFGEARLEDVCRYLASEINKTFLEPLRQNAEHASL